MDEWEGVRVSGRRGRMEVPRTPYIHGHPEACNATNTTPVQPTTYNILLTVAGTFCFCLNSPPLSVNGNTVFLAKIPQFAASTIH